jgi:hypothetical protein
MRKPTPLFSATNVGPSAFARLHKRTIIHGGKTASFLCLESSIGGFESPEAFVARRPHQTLAVSTGALNFSS